GSSIGVTGALWAIRRELYCPVPPDMLADDLYLPMMVVGQKRRVAYAVGARAIEVRAESPCHDFARHVRTLAGNFQLLRVAPWLLYPIKNRAFFAFLSHKVLRLLTPLCLGAALLAALMSGAGLFSGCVLAAQTLLFGLALAGCFAEGVTGA